MFREISDSYRQSYLAADLKQAKIGILLLTLPLVLFFYNDYLFFSLSLEFYLLTAARLGLIIYTIIFYAYLGRIKTSRQYFRSAFTWGLAGAAFQLAVNSSRPESFLFHVIMVIILIFANCLVIPQTFIRKLILSLTLTIGELAIIVIRIPTVGITSLFSVVFSLVLANIIGLSMSRLMESYRVSAFKSHLEITNLAHERNMIIDGIGDILFVMDKNRVITKVNKVCCDAFKKKPEELIGKYCYEIVHGTEVPWCNCPATKTFETKQTVTGEVNDPRLGFPLLVTTSPILDGYGEVAQVIHLAKDITQIKQAELEMHIAANLFEVISDSVIMHDLSGNIIYFNEAAPKTRGYTREEFQALTIQELENPIDNKNFGSKMKELIDIGKITFETVNLRKDKTVIPVEIHAQFLEFDGRKLVLSVVRDISRRKAVEEKLIESQEKYEITFESSMDALMLLDEKGFFDCNKSTLNLFGTKSVEEFSKCHPADLSPPTQPDGTSSMESAINHINKAFETGADSFFWIHKRTDGTTFPADVLLTRITLKNRNVLQATVRDVTERKESEEKLKENSRRIELMVEKLRVVGSLTRHDVRNKLSAVTGYAYLLKKKHPDQADITEGLGKMEQSVRESMKIFEFAKLYEQLGAEELTYIDVEAKLNEACALFSGSLPKIINDCHGLTVLADSFLRQMFYNFIDNTRKYGQKTTTIKVHCKKTDQGNLELLYEDDGVGISAENKLKLFSEGFRTGGSTGFGLFLTKKMIEVYDWEIAENGTPGEGVKFTITIPKLNKSGKENYQTA
jgi:PAS domain S-box-containing protein